MENLEICKSCGGICCKSMGCHYSPDDFKDLSFEGLKQEIDKGYISIDWWNKNPFEDERNIYRAYFLRVRNIDSEIIDPAYRGKCSLLTDVGCLLSYKYRPKGGRTLIPALNNNCIVKYDKQDCAKEWYEYNEVLCELVEYYFCKENDKCIADKSYMGIFNYLNSIISFNEL